MTDVAAVMSGAADASNPAAGDGQTADNQNAGAQAPADGQQPAGDQAQQSGAGDTTKTGEPGEYQLSAGDSGIFDPELVGKFSDVAKGAKLSQEAAQPMMDGVATLIAERNTQALSAAKEQWAEQTKADKEIGGEKLAENLSIARKALSTFGSPELDDLLARTGLGSNPHFIRAWLRAGKAISEDHITTGPATQTKTDAKSFYPNSNMN